MTLTSHFLWKICAVACMLGASGCLAHDPPVNEQASLEMGNSMSLPEILRQTRGIDLYLIGRSRHPSIPPNYRTEQPQAQLDKEDIELFYKLLGPGSSRERFSRQFAKGTIGCIIWKEGETIPAYLYVTNFQDGRWYVNYYSSEDSVGRFNNALGEFVWSLVAEN